MRECKQFQVVGVGGCLHGWFGSRPERVAPLPSDPLVEGLSLLEERVMMWVCILCLVVVSNINMAVVWYHNLEQVATQSVNKIFFTKTLTNVSPRRMLRSMSGVA